MRRASLFAVVAAWLFASCGAPSEGDRIADLKRRLEIVDSARRLGDEVALVEAQSAGPHRRAAVLNDLAVTHTEWARAGHQQSLIIGLDAVERAWELDRTPAIARTRAMLMSSLASNHTVSSNDVLPVIVTGLGFDAIEQYDRVVVELTNSGDHERAAAVLLLRAEMLATMGAADEGWTDLFKARRLSAARPVIEAIAIAAARDGYLHAARALLDDAMIGVDEQTHARLSNWRGFVQRLIEGGLFGIHVAFPGQLPRVTERLAAKEQDVVILSARSRGIVHAAGHRLRYAQPQGIPHDLYDSTLAIMAAESVQHLYDVASRTEVANGSPVAALWFSDRARRVAIPQDPFSCVGKAKGETAETMGQRLAECVPKNVALIHQDLNAETLNTWVVRNGHITFRTTPVSAPRLRAEIEQFVGDIQRGSGDSIVRRQATNLYDVLVRPMEAQITGTDLLVYSPSANLRDLPFGALHDGNRFVVQRSSTMTATTISAFELPHGPANSVSAMVVLPTESHRARELLGARREVREVQQIYGSRAMLAIGDAATPEVFLGTAAQYDVLHLSSHGYPSNLPYQSGIDFGRRRIRAYDVVRLRLDRAPVVMLAACRTATQSGGPANLSLANAFLAAGASAVVGSLWNVDDTHTADLSIAFHRELARGVAPQDALRNAQLHFIRRGMPPSAWAAFQVGA